MSFAPQEPLKPYGVLDPLIRQYEKVQPIEVGPQYVNYQVIAGTSITDASTGGRIEVDVNPASENIYIDRRIYLRLCCRLKINIATSTTGCQNGVNIIREGAFSLRSFPAQKAMESLRMHINNFPVDVEIGKIMSALELFNISERCKRLDLSKCATYPICQSSEFSTLYGTARNPLALFSEGPAGSLPHGAQFTVISNTATASQGGTAWIDFVSTEPLFLSPCWFGPLEDDNAAFLGVNQMSLSMSFATGGGNRMIAIDPSSPAGTPLFNSEANARAASVTCTMYFQNFTSSGDSTAWSYDRSSQTAVLVKQLTPSEIDKNLSMRVKYYPYAKTRVWVTSIGSISSGSSSSVVSANMQHNSIPVKNYFFIRPKDSVLRQNPFLPDTFIQIYKAEVLAGNQTRLNDASPEQLYDVSVRNGLEVPYMSWSGEGIPQSVASGFGTASKQYAGCGSVIAFSPLDLGLPLRQAPGKSEYFNMQITAYYENTTDLALNCDLFVVSVYSGGLFLFEGQAIAQTGLISENDVIAAQDYALRGMQSYKEVQHMYGAGMDEDVKHELQQVVKKASAPAAGRKVSRKTLRARLG